MEEKKEGEKERGEPQIEGAVGKRDVCGGAVVAATVLAGEKRSVIGR